MSTPTDDARALLKSHFSTNPPGTSQNTLWSSLWDAGTFLPWDRGFANPALEDILSSSSQSNLSLPRSSELLGESKVVDEKSGVERRKRALVPGCGKGYDVRLLARFGYEAFGLEVSDSAVRMAVEVGKKEEEGREGGEGEVKEGGESGGTARYIVGDFFEDGWLEDVRGKDGDGNWAGFELIYDYTFLSALPPSKRPAWALRMSQLLAKSPQGNLICVEFPTYKHPSTGGPPFGLPPKVYLEHLSHPGEEIPYDEEGNVIEDPERQAGEGALERVAHWQPERTHEVGKGTDWVSIWRH